MFHVGRIQWSKDRELDNRVGVDEVAYAVFILVGALLWISASEVLSIGLLISGALVAVASPVAAFWACCAAIPLVYLPIEIGTASLTLLETGLILTIGGILARLVLERSRFSFAAWVEPAEIGWVWLGASALLVAGILAMVFQPSEDHLRESLRTYRWVAVEAIAAFVAARYALGKRGEGRIVAALTIPAVLVSLWAIGDLLFSQSTFEADGFTRATASYLHPNNLALYLTRVFILLAGAILLTRSIPRHWLAATAIIGAALAATLSRGALIGAVAGMLVIAWYAQRRNVLMAVLAATAAAPVAFLLLAQERFLGGETSGLGSTRFEIWSSTIKMIQDYPVSGIGLDQFLYQHNPRYIDPAVWPERYISHPHNLILDSWLSLGLPGLLLLGGAMVALARQSNSIRLRWSISRRWAAAATASLAAGLAHSLVDNGYFLADLAVFTWILIALSLGPICANPGQSAGPRHYVANPLRRDRTPTS